MTQKNFFEKLKKELHGHPFQDRYLKELEAHAEDLEIEKLNEEKWRERMGDPKQVKKDFIEIVSPWAKFLFYGEALLWGILLWPVMRLFSISLIKLFEDTSLFSMSSWMYMLSYLALIALSYVGLTARYYKIKSRINQPIASWYLIIFLPTFFSTIATFNSSEIDIIYLLYTIILTLFGVFFSYLGFKVKKLLEANKKNPNKKISVLYGKLFIFAYFLSYLIYRNLETYQSIEINYNDSFWDKVFTPLVSLEQFMSIGGSMILKIVLPAWANAKLFSQVYLPGIIILALALFSLIKIYKSKKKSLLHSLIIIYFFSLFFIKTEAYEGNLNFKVSAINLSKMIEQKQASIFYKPMKYYHRDESDLFKYKVHIENNYFIVENNDKKLFWINTSKLNHSINEAKYEEIIQKTEKAPQNFESIKNDWPKKLKCAAGTRKFEYPGEVLEMAYDGINDCNQIFYDEKIILDSPTNASNLVISENQKWAIFIQDGGYDPDSLYLVNLEK